MQVGGNSQQYPGQENDPWSFKNGKLLFNKTEHKVTSGKPPSEKEIDALVNKLNLEHKEGIQQPQSVTISKLLSKKTIEVLPPEITTTYAEMALKAGVKPKDLHTVIAHATSVVANPKQIKEFFELLKDMSENERALIIDQTKTALAGLKDSDKIILLKFFIENPGFRKFYDEGKKQLVDLLKNLPKGEAKSIIELAKGSGIKNPIDMIYIIEGIKNLPQEKRKAVVEASRPYFKDFTSSVYGVMFMEVVNKIENPELLEKAWPFIRLSRDDAEKVALLKGIIKFPPDQIGQILEDAQPLFALANKNMDQAIRLTEKQGILRQVGKMDPNGRKEFIEALKPLWQGIQTRDPLIQITLRSALLKELTKFPAESRVLALRHAVPLLQNCRNVYGMVEVLAIIRRLPTDEMEDILAKAEPIVQGVTDTQAIKDIIQAVKEMPADERESIVSSALSLLQDGAHDGVRAQLLQLLAQLNPERRTSVLEACAPFLNHFQDPSDRLIILRAFLYVSPGTSLDNALALLNQGGSASQIANALRSSSDAEFRLNARLEQGVYRIVIPREQIKQNPLGLLAKLAENIDKHKIKQLSIVFEHEEGIDASGLGREFVSLLSEAVVEALRPTPQKNGLVRAIPMNEDNKQICQQLGKLMMFCLNSTQNYPMGMIFDHGFFAMLSMLQPHHGSRALQDLLKDNKTFNELFTIYLAMESTNEKEADTIARLKSWNTPFNQNTDPAVLSDLYFSESCMFEERGGLDKLSEEEIKADPSILKQPEYMAALQEVAREKIAETIMAALQPVLPAAIEVAKGMQSVNYPVNFDKAQKMGPAALSEKLQGTLSTPVVLQNLKFSEDIPPEKQNLFKEWIETLPPDQLKRFVFALTGAYAVGKAELKLFPTSERVIFHTCFSYADIPFNAMKSKEDITMVMAAALTGEESFNIG